MIMKKYLSFFAAALLLAACQSDDIVDQKGLAASDGTIQFGVKTTQEKTRTPGQTVGVIGTADASETPIYDVKYFDPITMTEKLAGFGVFGCYTGDLVYENATVTPDFMYNQQVIPVDNSVDPADMKWTYEPVKYWPNTGKTTFFAYAPYIDYKSIDFEYPEKSFNIAGMSQPYDEGDPWLIYVLSSNPFDKFSGQRDLLFGVNEDNHDDPWYNQEKATVDNKMTFTFKHALGIIGDKIRIQVSDELQTKLNNDHSAKIYIDHIDMKFKNLTRKAKLVLNSRQGYPNWKPIVSGEVTTTREYTITRDDIINVDPAYVADEGLDYYQTYYNTNSGITSANTVDGEGNALTLLTKKGLMYIPYQVAEDPQIVEVTLYYQVLASGMEAYNGVAKSYTELMTQDGQCSDIVITLGETLKYDKIYAPKIGDFYYSDGTWGEKNAHETGAKPIGTICYLGDNIGTYNPETGEKGTAKHGLVMAFKNSPHTFAKYSESTKYNRWGEYGDTPLDNFGDFQSAYNDLNGEYNTNVLFNLWTVRSAMYIDNFWAAWDCAQYATEGVGAKGKWHIGTFGEWALICDALGKEFGNGSGTDIKDAIEGGSISDGTEFYTSSDGTVEGSFMENFESNNSAKFWMFDPGFEGKLGRNKLQNGLRYWTSTEASQANAISFEFKYNPLPNYSDAVMFFISTNTNKEKQYLVRPLLTF